MGTDKRFRVALSFPGERRGFVEQVADYLSQALGRDRILYDAWYEAEFARPDLDTYLQALYRDQSDLICVFLCADYERKDWCGLEWRAVRDLIKRRQGSAVMPLRFDMTEIPGLFSTDGYVWLGDGRDPAEVATLILERWQLGSGTVAAAPAQAPGQAPVTGRGPGRSFADILDRLVLGLVRGGIPGTALPDTLGRVEGPGWGWLAEAVKRLVPGRGPTQARLLEEPIRLDTHYPLDVQVEVPFDLAVAVRRPDSPPLAIADLPGRESAKGRVFHTQDQECVRYRIEVRPPPDCEVNPDHWEVPLSPGEDADPVYFRVLSHGQGPRSFVVVAYQDDGAVAAQTRVVIPVKVQVAGPQPGPGPRPPRPSPAQATWQEKLDYLLEQEALAVDPAQKFKLRKDIEECRAKLRELGGEG